MNEAKRDVGICIGATIAIIASVAILARVFHVDVEYGLGFVGFWFLVGLPTYILYRKRKSEERNATGHERHRRLLRCLEVLEEIEELLDASITGFKEFGWHIKDLEKTDEKAYYADVALLREAGTDTGGLSAEYGKDVSYLINIQRMLGNVTCDLEQLNPYRIAP